MIIKKSDGFSLMELMIVVAIVGIASLIAIPQFLQWRKDFNLKGSARDLMGYMQKAKLTAVKERSNTTITILDDNTGFTISNPAQSLTWKDYVYLDSGNTNIKSIAFQSNGLANISVEDPSITPNPNIIVLKSVESAGDSSSTPRKYVQISVTLAGSITIESFTPPSP